MPEALKPVLIRQMEVYAGFLEYADHHVGRLIDALQDLGILGDTLVHYVIGDNGASAEGTLNGTFDEMINFNGARPELQFWPAARRPAAGLLDPSGRRPHAIAPLPVDQAGRLPLGRPDGNGWTASASAATGRQFHMIDLADLPRSRRVVLGISHSG